MPAINFNLANLFTPQAIAQAIRQLNPLQSTIIDHVYKNKGNHPFPTIGLDEVSKTIKNIPVVKRGTASYPLDGGSRDISFIEPQPVNPSRSVTAAEINNLRLLDANARQNYVTDVVDEFRRTVHATTEALCAQSITGRIQYDAVIEGGAHTEYDIQFGNIKTVAIQDAKKWTPGKATVADVITHIIAMNKEIKKSGYGTGIVYFAGSEAFTELIKLITALNAEGNSMNAKITEAGIQLAGFTIQHVSDTYTDYRNKKVVDVINPKHVVAIATGAPHRLRYLAIDDVQSNFLATPLHTRVIPIQDPSGYKIIAQSKPLPMPVCSAICKAVVL